MWHGEKTKPKYTLRWQFPSILRNRTTRLLAIFLFVVTTISLYIIFTGNKEPVYDVNTATKEYHEFLESPEHKALIYPEPDDRAHGRAAIISLVRNSELDQMVQSMRELEETFNRKFKYTWIFFNDEPFTDKFIRITSSLTDAPTQYGSISSMQG